MEPFTPWRFFLLGKCMQDAGSLRLGTHDKKSWSSWGMLLRAEGARHTPTPKKGGIFLHPVCHPFPHHIQVLHLFRFIVQSTAAFH